MCEIDSNESSCQDLEDHIMDENNLEQFWKLERMYIIKENFLAKQVHLTGKIRAKLINWLVDMQIYFSFQEKILQMAVAIIDRYLQVASYVKTKRLQLIGIAALIIASKHERHYAARIRDLICITKCNYKTCDVNRCLRKIVMKIRGGLCRPVPLNFLVSYIRVSRSSTEEKYVAEYFVNLSLVDSSMSHYKPSELAAAAVCLSRYLLSEGQTMDEVWTHLLVRHSRYKLDHIKPILYKIAKILSKVLANQRKAVYNKFSRSLFDCVACLPELRGHALKQLILKADPPLYDQNKPRRKRKKPKKRQAAPDNQIPSSRQRIPEAVDSLQDVVMVELEPIQATVSNERDFVDSTKV